MRAPNNLNWDRFAYSYPAWGRAAVAGPMIPTQVEGPAPRWRDVAIASRAACDQNPLDPANADDRLRLRSYIWADQMARMERLNAALELGGRRAPNRKKPTPLNGFARGWPDSCRMEPALFILRVLPVPASRSTTRDPGCDRRGRLPDGGQVLN